ncbi:MAG: tRNA-binding protein [Bacteroidota bacterium]
MDKPPAAPVSVEDFLRVERCTGTTRAARLTPNARQPAYILDIDFGARGTKTSSAQLTANCQPAALVGKQIVAVMNVPTKRMAGVKSEVLVLGVVSPEHGVVLLEPAFAVEGGIRIA